MMQNYTDITVVLDKSGSMSKIKNDMMGGFNEFLAKQQEIDGKCTISMVQFSTFRDIKYTAMDVREAPKLDHRNYSVNGGTALIDAMVDTIDETGHRLAMLPVKERPDRVLFVVVTDGEENASSRFQRQQLLDRINHQKTVYKWDFVYLGANQDSIQEASKYGFSYGSTMDYRSTKLGTRNVWAAAATYTASTRNLGANDATPEFSLSDRTAAMDPANPTDTTTDTND